ncbi:MAG: caspase family protein [Planctomycetes bacterium]|nr:caspase family protein [Planctomycetota bacterium]
MRIGFLRVLLLIALLTPAAQAGDGVAAPAPRAEPSKAIGLSEALSALPPGVQTPNRWALVIGASAYQDKRIPQLPACANDARALAGVLVDSSVGMFPVDHVTVLVDGDVTAVKVKDALDELSRHAGPSDLVVVFFSGHGATDDKGRAFWVMTDTQIDKLRATALPETDVSELLGEVKTTRLVTLIDACYSASTANLGQSKSLLDLKAIFPQFQGDGRVALTASKGDQLSVVIHEKNEAGYGYSAFAWHVIEGLKGGADGDADGVVTVDELWNHVKDRTEETARRQGGNQQPQLKGQFGSKFLLAVNAKKLMEKAKTVEAGKAQTVKRVGTLKQLFADDKIAAEQLREGRRVLETPEDQLDEQDVQRKQIYADLADGGLKPSYLQGALDKVETPEQRTARLAREAAQRAEAERQAKEAVERARQAELDRQRQVRVTTVQHAKDSPILS